MLFYDTENKRQVDVFVGTFSMCHRLDLSGRLGEHAYSLDAADLLLTKLQIHEINRKDLVDAVRLLLTHENADIARRRRHARRDVARPAAVGDVVRLGLVHHGHRQPAAGPRTAAADLLEPARGGGRRDPRRRDRRVAAVRTQVHALEGAQRRRPQDALVRAARRESAEHEGHEDLLRHGHPRLRRVSAEVPERREVLRRRRGRDGRRHHRQDDRAGGGGVARPVRRPHLRPQAGRRLDRAARAEQVHRGRRLLPPRDDTRRDGGTARRPGRASTSCSRS